MVLTWSPLGENTSRLHYLKKKFRQIKITNMNQFHKKNHTLCPFPDDSFKSSWDETAKIFPKASVSTPIRSVMGSVLKGINFLGKKVNSHLCFHISKDISTI